jgi:hypothetical protein
MLETLASIATIAAGTLAAIVLALILFVVWWFFVFLMHD